MAPKKKTYNAFSVFMQETQQKLAEQGVRKRMSEMSSYCTPLWEKMSDQEKDKFKLKSKQMKNEYKCKKYTSIGENVEDVKRQSEDCKSQTDAMYKYIEELVRVHPPSHYLPKQKFILIHINPYTCEKEGFFFPAEISMAEFSLERGLIRTFHQLVGFDKNKTNAPPAPTADINNHAINNHKITPYMKFTNNYTKILLKIIGFIIEKNVDEDVLNDSTLDMPPMYTAHSSTANELMITSSSLYQLYLSSVKNACKDHFNSLISIFHLDKLFMELKNISHDIRHKDENIKAVPSVAMATDNLTRDMFNTIKSVGCNFHEKLEHAHICSNYYVCKWIYIFSTHCCHYFNIKLVSGCHYDFDLSNSEKPIEEVIENLNISKNFNFSTNYSEDNPPTLTANSFPALKGKLSTSTQKPTWSRPEVKVKLQNESITNRDNNFPPLGNLQKAVSESNSNIGMNSWCYNNGRDKCTTQIRNNTAQLNESPKKSAKGRGRAKGN